MSERGRLSGEPAEAVVLHILEPTLREEIAHYWTSCSWAQRAHAVMLAETGILERQSAAAILEGLAGVERDGLGPEDLDPRLDLFFNVERALGRRVGEDRAGRLHTGRSRNDLQATYQRMAVRDHLHELQVEVVTLRAVCLDLATEHVATLIPGYTHLQVAQPITLGHWAIAIHDSLARDSQRLVWAYDFANQSPLGAGALAGTGWPIDRRRTAALLGFDGLVENTLDAVASRDYLIDALAAVSATLTTASRCATDLLLWSSWEFGLVELDDAYAGISSIMPQKKNPLTLEHCRARAAHGLAALVSVLAVLKGIPFTHTRDSGKEAFHLVFDAFTQATATVQLLTGVLSTLRIDRERAARAASTGFATVTDLADALVAEHGLSFRAAHQVVSVLVRRAMERGLDVSGISTDLVVEASAEVLGRPLSVSADMLQRALDPRANVEARSLIGGPAAIEVRRMLADRRDRGAADERALAGRRGALEAARADLIAASRLLPELDAGEAR